jgi:hypothetical protein
MATLYFQIQTSWTHPAIGRTIAILNADKFVKSYKVEKHLRAKEKYVNVTVKCASPKMLWRRLRNKLNAVPGFRKSTIVVGTGKHGWDDYIQLQHFDPTVPPDRGV